MIALNRGRNSLKLPFTAFFRTKSSQSSQEYCLDSIKKYDYENFICTILLQKMPRSVAIAIRGLNVELARIAEQVSQENIGLMRLKFWEETIDKCYSKDFRQVPKHPVSVELYKVMSKAPLSKRHLKTLVSARQKKGGLKSLEDMEKYAEQTVSSTYYLILEGSEIKNLDADHAASHLGKAQGIVQQLRGIPHSKQLGFIPIPEDILIKHKVSQEEVIRKKETKKLSDCVFEMASRAYQHLQKSRSLSSKVSSEAKNVLLPAVPVSIYLDRLQEVDYNVLHPSLQQRSWKMLPNIYFSRLTNKY